MKAVIWLIIPLFVSAPLKSQHSSKTIHPGAVVATLDGEPVTAGELASIFDKNQEPGEPDPDGMREFLPDYIEYRLKLRYGTDQGIRKEQDILDEFEQYGREAAYSYWLENEIKQLIIETCREVYQLDRQFHFHRISTVSDSLIVKVKEKISAGRHPEKIMRDFAGLSVTTDSVSNRYSDSYERLSELDAGGSTDIIQRGSVQYMYYLERISEPRLMTFDEAFNRVANDYIPVREKNFLTRLKEKYPVKMYPENITSTE
jgi:hypothetical protein